MLPKIKQMAIAGDDGIGACGEGAGDDVIVVGIVRHDARHGVWCDAQGQLAVRLKGSGLFIHDRWGQSRMALT